MSARSWRIAGPFGSQERIGSSLSTDQQSGQGYRLQAGTPNPPIGSPAGYTVIVTIVALQDFGIGTTSGGAGFVCSGDAVILNLNGGYLIGVEAAISPPGYQFSFVQADGVGVASVVKDLGTGNYPKRGNGIIVTANWDAVAGLMKLKTSYDSSSAQMAAPGFLPFINAAISDFAFSLGHANSAFFGIDTFPTDPIFGIANVYYSTTKTQWTDQEISDFEDEIKATMATDSSLPIPEGTTESDWTIFDSRQVASGSGSGPWTSRNGVYMLQSDLFVRPAGNGNNEFQQLRNINFPVSGL